MNLFNNKLIWSLIGTGLGIYVAGARGASLFRYTAGAAIGAMVLNQLQGTQRGRATVAAVPPGGEAQASKVSA